MLTQMSWAGAGTAAGATAGLDGSCAARQPHGCTAVHGATAGGGSSPLKAPFNHTVRKVARMLRSAASFSWNICGQGGGAGAGAERGALDDGRQEPA